MRVSIKNVGNNADTNWARMNQVSLKKRGTLPPTQRFTERKGTGWQTDTSNKRLARRGRRRDLALLHGDRLDELLARRVLGELAFLLSDASAQTLMPALHVARELRRVVDLRVRRRHFKDALHDVVRELVEEHDVQSITSRPANPVSTHMPRDLLVRQVSIEGLIHQLNEQSGRSMLESTLDHVRCVLLLRVREDTTPKPRSVKGVRDSTDRM